MMLARALHAEILKLKRTLALKLVLLAPISVVLLTLFMASQMPFSTLHRNPASDDWKALTRINLQFWGMLMLPLYLSLQTALLAGLDHSGNQWKSLFARALPRWTVYVSKLLLVLSMAAASAVILILALLAEAQILLWYNPELRFASPPPLGSIVEQTAQMTGLAFLALTILHWVSLRWRAFSVAIGFGMVAIVTSFAMLMAAGPYGAWPQYFPWSLPMLVVSRHPENIQLCLWLGALAGLCVTAIGCANFCRREVV